MVRMAVRVLIPVALAWLVLSALSGPLANYLWFQNVGFGGVWAVQFTYTLALFLAGLVGGSVVLLINLVLAWRPPVRRSRTPKNPLRRFRWLALKEPATGHVRPDGLRGSRRGRPDQDPKPRGRRSRLDSRPADRQPRHRWTGRQARPTPGRTSAVAVPARTGRSRRRAWCVSSSTLDHQMLRRDPLVVAAQTGDSVRTGRQP